MEQYRSKVNRTKSFHDKFVKSIQKEVKETMYIYQRLKDLREDEDLTQTDIAIYLNTSREQYSRWERGATEIPMHIAILLARKYRVSMDYLTGLTNNKKGSWCK